MKKPTSQQSKKKSEKKDLRKNNRGFTHLHVHSHYSLLDGLPKIDEILDYVQELGMDSVALTDHGNIYGAVEFYKKAKERGIKPIIGCLPPGYLIYTAQGMKPIEKIKPGDLVLTHKGRFRPVQRTMVRHHHGYLYGIQAANTNTTWVTEEHPILITDHKTEKFRWVRADELPYGRRNRHGGIETWKAYALFPKIKESQVDCLNLLKYLNPKIYGTDGKTVLKIGKYTKYDALEFTSIPFNLEVNENIAKMMGLFLAEGSYQYDTKGRPAALVFSYGNNENQLVNLTTKTLQTITKSPVRVYPRPERNSKEVLCGSTILSRVMQNLCGKGAGEKYISLPILKWSKPYLKNFLEGLVAGDGHISPETGQINLRMKSRDITWGVRLILATLGIPAKVSKRKEGTKIIYQISWSPSVTYRRVLENKDYLFFPIKEVKKQMYDGPVYNFEVKEDHSYVGEITLHNCEIYMALEGMSQKRPGIDDKKHHLVLLVKNEQGYKNLVKLITLAHLEGFYYKPRIDEKLLAKYSEGLICFSACLAGKIPKLILSKKIEEAEKLALKYQEMFGRENFYLEVQHHPNSKEQKIANEGLIFISQKYGIPLIATNDVHYLKPEDAEAQDILMLINTGADPNDPERLTLKEDDFSMRSAEQMIKDFKEIPQAIENTQKVVNLCNFEFNLGETQLPHFEVPNGKSAQEYLKELCLKGVEKRYSALPPKEIMERLNYELSVIKETGFASYFLIVQDFVNWAKENRIVVGPGRGCLLPNTKILMANGQQKNIQKIRIGDFVISRKGKKQKVTNIFNYDVNEKIAVIKSKMLTFKEVECTPDHKVLATKHRMCPIMKRDKKTICKPACNRSCKNKLWKKYKLEWIEARNLTKNDFLVYPITPQHHSKKFVFDLMKFDKNLRGDNKYVWYEFGTNKLIFKKIKRFIKLNENLARLLGFYVAEGWGRTEKNQAAIGFGFHKNELENIKEVRKLLKKIFNLESTIIPHKTRGGSQVYGYSKIVALFFQKLCGKGALNKHIPQQIFESPNQIIVQFLTTLFKGDGSHKDSMRFSFDSTSLDLISQIKMLLARMEIMSSVKNWHTSFKLTVSGKQLFHFNDLFKEFQVPIKKQKFYRNDTFIQGNYIYFPVKNVEFKDYKGKIYDFTVKKDISYVANDITVHNSVAGSLVSYVLGITNVDPLKYNLLFERFLNPERISMPDIDLDFTDRRRDEVIEYIAEKYGRDKVAQIITFGTMAARAAVRDVGRALGYSYSYCDRLAKLIPFGFSLKETLEKVSEFRQLYEMDDKARKLIDFAKKLEGRVRHASTHACGIVISKMPLDNVVPLQRPTQDDKVIVTQYEMHSIEDLGLLKMDLLGLKNLTIIEETLSRIYAVQNKKINLEAISLIDQKTYKLLQKGETTGVFQLESGGMKRYLKQLKPSEFEDIIAMIALYRPGPISLIPEYIRRKEKGGKIEYLHPKLEPILKPTYGVMIFQEQLMQIAQDLAGFSLAEADVLRKAVGKKIKKLLLSQKEKFISGSIKNGIEKATALKIWNWILPFAHYGFNKCLAGDTEIPMMNGEIKTIEELYKNGLQNKSVVSLNKEQKLEFRKINDIQENGIKEIYEIETTSGRKIQATKNHRFLVFKSWKKLKELKESERIATWRCWPIREENEIRWPSHKSSLLGYVLSEGNTCHPCGFYLYTKSKEKMREYVEILEKFKNTKATVSKREKKGTQYSVYAGRINLKDKSEAVEWIKNELGLKYKKATEKFLPKEVFRLNKKDLGVLIGKMWNGDGNINIKNRSLFYATSSEKLARGLQNLLLKFGILSRLYYKEFNYRKTKKPGWAVYILRYNNLAKFYQYIGPHLIQEQKEKLKKLIKNHPILKNPNQLYARGTVDTIPAPIVNLFRNECLQMNSMTMKNIATSVRVSYRLFMPSSASQKKGFQRETIQRIAKTLNSKELKNHANSDIFWDRIKSIKYVGKKQTYDLTISKNHNFVANGFIVHNSHSACYATIAYQTAYLKANFPVEFMAALLTAEKADTERIGFLIEECKKMRIEVLAPDINESFRNFSVIPESQKIRFGLFAIKNVGENVVNSIIEERKKNGIYESVEDFISRVKPEAINKKSLESLIKAGVFDKFEERNQLFFNIERLLEWSRENKKNSFSNQKSLFSKAQFKSSLKLEKAPLATRKEKLSWEKELLGLYVTSHPLEDFKKIMEKKTTKISELNDSPVGRKIRIGSRIRIGGIISKIKKIITKNGKPMLFMSLEDLTDKIEVVVFPKIMERNPTVFRENKIVLVRGKVDERDGATKLICDDIEEILDIKES